MATYYGGGGNDTVNANFGNDVVYAYGGNDTVNAYGGQDSVYAGDGADSVFGGTGNDTLYGESGNDTLKGDSGYDATYGGAGDDSMVGGSDLYDDFYGGDGNDTIIAGDYDEDWAWGEAGNDSISMGAGSDLAWGGAGNDTISGGLGNDKVQGDAGADFVSGDAGQDTALGGAGNDTVYGGTENDTVMGGSGGDALYGGTGADLIRGDSDSWDSFDTSTGPVDTTLTVVNSATFSVDLYWIDLSGAPQYFTTIAPGGSWSANTGSTHNWFLTEAGQTNPIQVIHGAPNQTVTFAPPFDDMIYGGDGNDTIFGDYGNDSVSGDAGDDNLTTGLGNDTVYGGLGNDTANLGDGDDRYGDWSSEAGNDTVFGGAGHDSLLGGGENDLLYGDAGNDTLSGGIGQDSSYGGAGNDAAIITNDHTYDYYDLGETAGDFDALWFGNYLSSTGVAVTFSGSDAGSYAYGGGLATGDFTGVEAISATEFADSINAALSTSDQAFTTYGGADNITTGSGNDLIDGGTGNDTIVFGTGNDTVYGGDGADSIDDNLGGWVVGDTYIEAGSGNDTIWHGAGNDTVYGGDGNDLIDDHNGGVLTGSSSLSGDAGDDTIWAGGGNDSVYGGAGNDNISGETDNDLIEGGDGNDTLWGGDGNDTLDGGQGADYLLGDAGVDTINLTTADFANDVAYGGAGNDTLTSRLDLDGGSDTLYGGDGRDVLTAGANDSIFGGEGGDDFDTVDLSTSPIGGTVTLTGNGTGTITGGGATLTFSEIEAIDGTAQADIIYGGADTGGMTYSTGAGNDSVTGGAGGDSVLAGDGDDSVVGGGGNDTVFSGIGNDSLFGGTGDDSLYGGVGNDALSGGDGNDRLTGGAGFDQFVLIEAGGGDTVTDFEMGLSGGLTTDQLDVSGLQNPDTSPVKAWDVQITDAGGGNTLLTFPEGETLVLQGVDPATVAAPGVLAAMGVPCFAVGTRIMTPKGPRAVETLGLGDMVTLADGGGAPVIWVGQRQVTGNEMRKSPNLRPIRIRAGAHGALRDLILSRQHAIEVTSKTGTKALIRAGHLAAMHWGARQANGIRGLTYHHLLLPNHSVILAEGVRCETLYPGRLALAGFAPADRAALMAAIAAHARLGPGQSPMESYGPRCLPLLSFAAASRLPANRPPPTVLLQNQPRHPASTLALSPAF